MSIDYFTRDFTPTEQSRIEIAKLSNGDILEICGMILEYEDDRFYGVINRNYPIKGGIGNKIVGYGQAFIRTGISFTKEEINKVVKEIEKWDIV